MKFIFTHSGQIWVTLLQKVMRYDLFVEERYNVLRTSDIYKKSFICFLLKHRYIPHINNLLLIPDLFLRSLMTFYDVNKIFLPYKVNYGVMGREA